MNYYNYFTEIEETFVRRRGKNLLLSPLDWALMESWQEREIPLHIVLRGIETVFDGFDKQPARLRSVKSLSYCKEEIEAQFAEWLETRVGQNESSNGADEIAPETVPEADSGELFSRAAIDGHLKKLQTELNSVQADIETENLRETLERVSGRLAELCESFETAEKLEESLEKLDALIDETLLKQPAADQFKAEIERNLAAYRQKMEPDVFKRTFELMLLKKLRETSQIPRLSLFYI